MHPHDQTIFALSSGRPPSAIAIVRLSGVGAGPALQTLTGKLPPPRLETRALLRDDRGDPIDDAVVLWFPGPASATGEDVAELHVHGSRAVITTLVSLLSAMPQMRAADRGEFTRRAFENGKIDLTEAEGLDDLIHADTDRQRRQALRQLKGLLGDKARSWRDQIIQAAALIEAGIDFADEGDVPAELIAPALAWIRQLLAEIEEVLAAQGRAERLRDGLTVVIAGPPNAGKSTLMNQLARREVAIVSPHAGTTRDLIEVALDLGLKIMKATEHDLGPNAINQDHKKLMVELVEKQGRFGRKNGKGFYDYPEKGKGQKSLWPDLAKLQPKHLDPDTLDVEELKQRFLVVQAVEAARTVEDHVITDVREADVGSILGFGFAPFTGGTLSYIDFMGTKKFVELCHTFTAKYGSRFAPPKLLEEMAAKGETFYGRFPPKKAAA
ncbi:MAG: tRNA uridine-5-carboxymethylaminomethyl(34) synthesis GTPase MnmE [Bradyrhizobium sp.]|nr:tRNA uridine-5-carboxymethylaminomethyl(34) synthesis GTPase MnmE [Bradyrhizobium sp.]